jgi:hypothetical protein
VSGVAFAEFGRSCVLWFYESFFLILWVAFFIYWQIQAFGTKTSRFEPVNLAYPARPLGSDAVVASRY